MLERPVRLGDVISIEHGYAFSGSQFTDDPRLPLIVTPGNFAIGGGFRPANSVKSFQGKFDDHYALQPGDLIVTMTDLSKEGDTLGLPAFVPDDGHVYLHNQRIGRVSVTSPLVDLDFLGYYLRTAGYRQYVLATATGSTVRHTSPRRIADFKVQLPSVSAQRAIAKVLGVLDDKIAANSVQSTIAEKLASVIFRRAANCAPRRPMSDVVTPILGGTPDRASGEYWGGTHPWVSARDVTGAPHAVVLASEEMITDLAAAFTKARPIRRGSVIMTARGTVGAVARLGVDAAFNQSCYGFLPDKLPPSVLYFSVLHARDEAKAFSHGSVFNTITMKTFDDLAIPRFSSQEASALESRIAPLLAVVEAACKESRILAALRDALLHPLTSGRLRVRDAEKQIEEVV